ncbi:putative lipid-binding protein [Abeliophyllum distichum]|uniref:Lipid-binding protein n=1 Tax=Abeliophyllum distichum TaxID=126358 RepID=A0ABD1PB12_9LAMI
MFASKVVFLVIFLNIIFFSCVSSHSIPCPPANSPGTPSTPKKAAKCPRDTLKLGVCGDWLGLVHEVIGAKPSSKCCTLLEGLANLEAALCLCTAIKANVLGIANLEIPVALSLVINSCGKKVPKGFVCK